ncbi:MAG: hypothetical protein HKO57_16475, partial [Akkermansiaceae bacterium]|nr:hypothetical protein [Akkermansiaceae bacterium]
LLDTVICHPTTTDRFTYEKEFFFCRPKISEFTTSAQIVVNGATPSLDWNTEIADTLEIDQGVGPVTGDIGSTTVTAPSDADTTYTLTAGNTDDTATATATIRSVEQSAAMFRYYRFSPVRLREALPKVGGANSIQMGEFEFFNGISEVSPVGATDDGNSPPAEGPGNLIDGDFGSKWLNFGKGPVIFDMGSPAEIDGYSFTTGNDAPERDPIAWILEGSDDQACWITIDNVSEVQGSPGVEFNFLPPLGRGLDTQVIPLPTSPPVPDPEIALFGAFPQITTDNSTVTLLWETAFACDLEIDQGVGIVTGDMGSTTATPPNNSDTVYTLTATNAVGANVSFPGGVRTVGQGEAAYDLIRFTPLRLAETLGFFGGANSIQIAEFQFYNNGVALDLSPTGLNPGVSNPGGNFPGGEGPEKVVDGDPGTKWLDFNKQGLVFDFFPNTVTFDAYGWTTANDAAERDPVAWRLEGSSDGGATWELIDNVDKNRDNPAQDAAFYFGLPRGTTLPPIPVPDANSLPPLINLFAADAVILFPGEEVILTWETEAADSVTLDDGGGPVTVAGSGSQVETPTADTTWTLAATNGWGTVTAEVTTTIVTSGTDVICYENFDSAGDELSLLGDAAIVNAFPGIAQPGNANRLRLTPDEASKAGTAWFGKRIDFSAGFQTFFDLHFIGTQNAGADGLSFMIQNTPGGNGAEPDGFNEEGFPAKSLNIKFDSFPNAGETSAGSITVSDNLGQIAYVDLATFPGITLAGSTPADLSSDDTTVAPYEVKIDYDAVGKVMDIFFNGVLVIDDADVDLEFAEAVDASGKGWVGFSARTGGEYEAHDITRWILIPGPPAPPLEITDFTVDLDADTAVFTFSSTTTRTYRVTGSSDGQTFTNLATGIAGQAGSTTTGAIPFVETAVKLFRIEEESILK